MTCLHLFTLPARPKHQPTTAVKQYWLLQTSEIMFVLDELCFTIFSLPMLLSVCLMIEPWESALCIVLLSRTFLLHVQIVFKHTFLSSVIHFSSVSLLKAADANATVLTLLLPPILCCVGTARCWASLWLSLAPVQRTNGSYLCSNLSTGVLLLSPGWQPDACSDKCTLAETQPNRLLQVFVAAALTILSAAHRLQPD